MDDYYDESEPSTAQGAPRAAAATPKDNAPAQSTLIPKSLCPGMKPGQDVTLHIDKVLEEEYQVSYNKEKEPEGDEPEAGESEPESDHYME